MNIDLKELEKLKKIKMVFILGKGRSGTSLLQNLLDAHPGISAGPESRFAAIFYPCFAHIKKWKEQDIIHFVEKLYIEPLFNTFWQLDKQNLTETLLSVADIADYGLLCKIVYYQMRNGKENILYISDKNPEYILYLDTIEKIFPGATYLHIVREPRDNIYSQITSFNEKNTKFRAFQWISYNSIVEKRKKSEPDRYLTVLYEDLVRDTERTMKAVCDFLHIPFYKAMIQNRIPVWLNSHAERKGLDREKMIHRNLLKPISISNIGKWKNNMLPYDQAITEIITGDFAHKIYGYEIDSNRKNKPVKISWFTLLKGKWVYYIWQNFTQLKAKSFRFNLFYSRVRKRLKKNVPLWEAF